MNAKDIKKYQSWSVSKLLIRAEFYFNLFIRLRDTDDNGFGRCISSGQDLKIPSKNAHAGHYYPAGHWPTLRFNENNVHLQGMSDNFFKGSNAIEYRKNLIKKIGEDCVLELDMKADLYKRTNHKWDRFFLIETILTYRKKCKELAKKKNFKVSGL